MKATEQGSVDIRNNSDILNLYNHVKALGEETEGLDTRVATAEGELARLGRTVASLEGKLYGEELREAGSAFRAHMQRESKWGSGWAWAFVILGTGVAGLAVYETRERKQRAQRLRRTEEP